MSSVSIGLPALLLLLPTPALANIGLPMVAVYLPPAWLALLPIILVECGYGAWRFKIPVTRALFAQAAANCFSTLIGLPITWILLALGEILVMERVARVAPDLPPAVMTILGAAWLGPGAEQTWWMVPLAVAALTAPFYAMSVVSEHIVVARFFPDLPRRVIRNWIVRANVISYALLVVLVLAGWLWPRASESIFELMRPVNERLVAIVFRLVVADMSRGGETALIQAVDSGDLPTMRRLIAKGENVNATDSYGGTALQWAAGRGNEVATRMLLDAGADVGARRGPTDYAALHYAAWTGNGATVRTLLSAGARVNDAADGGWTPLMIAMLYGRPDVVEALLAGGADVNARTLTGWTALKEAEMRGHREIAERLVRAGAIDYPDGSR